jgi:hypothetical protein
LRGRKVLRIDGGELIAARATGAELKAHA